MDPFEHIARAADDRRSGSVAVAARAAKGLALLSTKRDLARAARRLVRAHPAMAPVWRLLAAAYAADDIANAVDRYVADLQAGTDRAADQIRWAVGRRRLHVVTHSSSDSVARALRRIAGRVERISCTVSLPGAEGRTFARRLVRAGFEAEVIPDAAVARACSEADLVLVGADAITEDSIINKVGTMPLVGAAQSYGVGAYAIAPTTKCVPSALVATIGDAFEATPIREFDAVLTERGPRRAPALARIVHGLEIPPALAKMAR